MSDKILRAIARNAGIQISAASTTGIVERAREIHNTTPLATAALGRTLTITSIMGSQLKVEDCSVTVQIKGNGHHRVRGRVGRLRARLSSGPGR